MSEIDLLLTKAQESIDAAQTLLEQSYPDFAASRAYYALFTLLRRFCSPKNHELTITRRNR